MELMRADISGEFDLVRAEISSVRADISEVHRLIAQIGWSAVGGVVAAVMAAMFVTLF
jgi:hypothetical protein